MRRILVVVVALMVGLVGVPPVDGAESVESGGLAAPVLERVEGERGAATLLFSVVDGAAGYNVYRDGEYLKTVSSSPYRDENAPGRYSYYVTAFDGSKEVFSPRSNVLKVDTRGSTTSTSVSPPTSQVEPEIFNLSVDITAGETLLSWDAPTGTTGREFQIYRFRPQAGTAEVEQHQYTSKSNRLTIPSSQANDLFLVLVAEGDVVQYSTGLYDVSGSCVALCSLAAWRSLTASARAVPAVVVVIVVRVIIREAARQAARWCARNPRDCASGALDALDLAEQINDLFEDNPATVIASERAADYERQGYEVDSIDADSGTVTMSNGRSTVEIQVLVTEPGEAGRVLTTSTRLGPNGEILSREVRYDWVSEDALNDDPAIDRTHQQFEEFHYDENGVFTGRTVTVYVRGEIVGVDCYGPGGNRTSCSDAVTTTSTSPQTTTTFAFTWQSTTRPSNFVTVVPTTERTTQPSNFVTPVPTTERTTQPSNFVTPVPTTERTTQPSNFVTPVPTTSGGNDGTSGTAGTSPPQTNSIPNG